LYPGDLGILSPLLLNIFILPPLHGLYLDAGILHAYLDGKGMEIMANSDNVLRGGLTPKHIDIPELVKVLDFESRDIRVLRARQNEIIEKIYHTPAREFTLSYFLHKQNKTTCVPPSGSAEILFCAEGNLEIENCSQILRLKPGQSLFVPYEMEGYSITGCGLLFRAKSNI
jgi:mannose-6-phosphate isomerase